MNSLTEKKFENKVKNFLKSEGCYYLKYNPEFYGIAGTPDLIICCKGNFLGVEVKRESGKASPLQLDKIEQIQEAGGIALVLRPSGFEDFKKLIRSL